MAFNGQALRMTRETMHEHGRKVSQQRFAEIAGYSKRTQERYETGQCEPRLAHLERIIAVTGKPAAFFSDEAQREEQEAGSSDDEDADQMAVALTRTIRAIVRREIAKAA